ncbi:MAG: hypothetical protein Q4G60_11035 [bacterium]|nr:hypothetical protein [bacterium]
MYSFARKKIYNPLNAGLIKENIHSGMFARKPDISRIAVFEINVKKWQYKRLKQEVEEAWGHHEQYKYNFLGLFTLIVVGCGTTIKDHFLCTEWVTDLLNSCKIELFGGKAPIKVTPCDYCKKLEDYIIYEGLTKDYPFYNREIQYSSAVNC